MRTTRVAAVSMNGFLGEPERVLDAIDGWCEKAAAEKAELVLFPELVVHGHCTPNTWELAEPVPDGPSVRRLVEIARRIGLFLCAGLSEKERDIVYNTQVLVGPRRLHRQAAEAAPVARRGALLQGRPGHPRLRHRPVQGRHRHLLRQPVPRDRPRAGPARRRGDPDAARRPVQALGRHARERGRGPPLLARLPQEYALRARENACFAVLADQAGRAGYVDLWPRDSENQPHHAGAALIWGPDGELIASTQEERIREEMIVATLDAAVLARERSLANYMLRTRRPELFGELVREQISS